MWVNSVCLRGPRSAGKKSVCTSARLCRWGSNVGRRCTTSWAPSGPGISSGTRRYVEMFWLACTLAMHNIIIIAPPSPRVFGVCGAVRGQGEIPVLPRVGRALLVLRVVGGGAAAHHAGLPRDGHGAPGARALLLSRIIVLSHRAHTSPCPLRVCMVWRCDRLRWGAVWRT